MLAAAAAAQTAAVAAAAVHQAAAGLNSVHGHSIGSISNGFHSPLNSATKGFSEKRKIIEEIALSDVKKVGDSFSHSQHTTITQPIHDQKHPPLCNCSGKHKQNHKIMTHDGKGFFHQKRLQFFQDIFPEGKIVHPLEISLYLLWLPWRYF